VISKEQKCAEHGVWLKHGRLDTCQYSNCKGAMLCVHIFFGMCDGEIYSFLSNSSSRPRLGIDNVSLVTRRTTTLNNMWSLILKTMSCCINPCVRVIPSIFLFPEVGHWKTDLVQTCVPVGSDLPENVRLVFGSVTLVRFLSGIFGVEIVLEHMKVSLVCLFPIPAPSCEA